MSRTVTNPEEIVEIGDRVEYAGLPWARRLATPPPLGWPGGYIGRAVGRYRKRRPHRRPVLDLDPA
jgi:hypothetical protein